MSEAQKIIVIAVCVVGLVCLLVGFSLMHYIGGFMRTIEEEAREEDDGEKTSAPPSEAHENKEQGRRQA